MGFLFLEACFKVIISVLKVIVFSQSQSVEVSTSESQPSQPSQEAPHAILEEKLTDHPSES